MATDSETTLDHEAADADDDREVSALDTDQDDASDADEGADDEDLDGAADEQADGDSDDADEDLEEVEWEGKTVRIPPAVKAALMRQADYTRKTQAVAAVSKDLEARQAEIVQQAELVEQLGEERGKLFAIDRQLQALDGLDWDKIEEEDPTEANRLFRQRLRLREQRDEIKTAVETKTKDLTAKRQTAACEADAQAIESCNQALSGKDGIKGWSPALAEKLGDFAIRALGYTPQEVLSIRDPKVIKTIHLALKGAEADKRERTQKKLTTAERTEPVKTPGGSASGAARRTTDSSGDKLSTAEWIQRENDRVAAKRAARR